MPTEVVFTDKAYCLSMPGPGGGQMSLVPGKVLTPSAYADLKETKIKAKEGDKGPTVYDAVAKALKSAKKG
eukprot:CAMPEP_0179367714 /NCGR_PEP_ID=MMETSP0797-20121207/83716_1 /TAXON_ID=47934 /ORGANISM="Dinophysis acuminata, Strain DAEP01" /LENGTH=70 /DNA_ID=CAMNT_0021083271 /DNA_START=45 /DNA_END=257 /DNA_ORIENTATION=-